MTGASGRLEEGRKGGRMSAPGGGSIKRLVLLLRRRGGVGEVVMLAD